jgi:hypothetical protein
MPSPSGGRPNISPLRTRYWSALDEWISRCALRATADRDVVHYVASGTLATCSWAGVGAPVSDASPVSRTVCAEDTFRSTTCVRVALIFRKTRAGSILTLSVRSARRRVARVRRYGLGS